MTRSSSGGPAYGRTQSRLQKALIGAAAVLLGLLVGVVAFSLLNGDDKINPGKTVRAQRPAVREPPALARKTETPALPPASAGSNGTTRAPAAASSLLPLKPGAPASFAALKRTLGASIGIAIAPLGPGSTQRFGEFQVGHAWSSIKVPIVVTLMRERGSSGLTAEEQQWASAALTASDNSAAASLFGELEQTHGGVAGASMAVQEVLAAAGDTGTTVATQPPPSGAISTFGQTEWSLEGSVAFYRALACGALLDPSGTDFVLGLMEGVVPEQRWGLGSVSFPPDVGVAFKAGWGPEGSSSGPYLVRQAGVLRKGSSGVAVTMMAQDASGSFEAGVGDLDQIAAWLDENLVSFNTGSCGT